MNRTAAQEQEWRRLNSELDAWFEKMEFSAPAQISFQRSNPQFSQWLDAQLVPSMLFGESAASDCLMSIIGESDEVLRHTKFLAAYSVWEGLDAPPNEIAADLHEQGWTQERLSEHLKLRMIAPYEAAKTFDAHAQNHLH